MTTCTFRRVRLVFLTLALGIVLSGVAIADGADGSPICADRQAGKACAPAMTSAAAKPALDPLAGPKPLPAACFWAWYEEYWKDNEICRWYNSCTGQRWGTCPNGYDFRTNEVFPCCK